MCLPGELAPVTVPARENGTTASPESQWKNRELFRSATERRVRLAAAYDLRTRVETEAITLARLAFANAVSEVLRFFVATIPTTTEERVDVASDVSNSHA